MGKGAVVMHSKSVKHVQNSENWKSSSAAMLASWAVPKILPKFYPPPPHSKRADDKILLAYVSDDFKTKKIHLNEHFFEKKKKFFRKIW